MLNSRSLSPSVWCCLVICVTWCLFEVMRRHDVDMLEGTVGLRSVFNGVIAKYLFLVVRIWLTLKPKT